MSESYVKRHHVRGTRCVICDSPVVKNIQLFPFPSRPAQKKAWLHFAKQFNEEVNPKSSQICSQHFDKGSWTLVQKKIGEFGIGTSYVLKAEAIPTIIKIQDAQSKKGILESKNSLLSMIMAPKMELPKNTPTRDISKKALHASIESVEKMFEICTVCGSSKRGSVVLHKLPSTILLKMKWLDFIEQATKKNLQIPMSRVIVCSQHFDDTCYDEQQTVMKTTGYGVKIKKVMKTNAIPSIFWVKAKNGEQQVVIIKDEEVQNDEHQSESSSLVQVKKELADDDEIEFQSSLPTSESSSGLIQSTRSNLEQLLNKSVQKFIRPKSEKEMYKLLSKCEKDEIQKIKSIRGAADEKPSLFACHCGEGFLSRALLIEHKKVHIPKTDSVYNCNICQAKFHTHRTYDQHLITHFGLNRRLCAYCGQSLASKVDFNKHIQMVHGGKCVVESTETVSALLKKCRKRHDDKVTSENEFEIEIDFDHSEPGDSLLPLHSEASTSQFSTSQNDCLGVIDKIANRLKNFTSSVSEPSDYELSDCELSDYELSDCELSDCELEDPVEKRKESFAQTNLAQKSRIRERDLTSTGKTNPIITNQDPTTRILAKRSMSRFNCTLNRFTDPRCVHSDSNTETTSNCLTIRISKIDDVVSQLQESPMVTMNSDILRTISKSYRNPQNLFPESANADIPPCKKKKKKSYRFGGRKRRIRNKVVRDIKKEVFEYKVVPIPELHDLMETKQPNLCHTLEGMEDHLLTLKTETIKREVGMKVSATDQENEDWKVVMNTDYDDEEPIVSEGVDLSANNLNSDSDEDREKENSQNQPLFDDFIPYHSGDSMSSCDDNGGPSDEVAFSLSDSGILLGLRSITENEFNGKDKESSSDSRPNSPTLGLSITNIVSIDGTSIKVEPMDSDIQDETRKGDSGDVNDMKIKPQTSTLKIKKEPFDVDVDENSTETLEDSEIFSEELIIFKKLHKEEPSVFFSQNDLDNEGQASTIRDKIPASDSIASHSEEPTFQFQNVNLYEGEVDPEVVDDQTKQIVDDLLQKLNTKKEKEAKITMEYFPTKANGPTEYSCVECFEGFHHKLMLEEHEKYHNKEKPFVCWICSSEFQEYTTYTGHLTQHVGKNTKMCFMCGYRTSTSRTLTNHFNSQHKNEEVKSSQNTTLPPKTSDTMVSLPKVDKEAKPCRSDPADRFTCELCHLICMDSQNLKRHLVSDCSVVKDALRPSFRT